MDCLDSTLNELGINTEDIEETSLKMNKECEEAGINTFVKPAEKAHQIFYGLSVEDREQAVREFIVPKGYRDSTFSRDSIIENIKEMYRRDKRKTIQFGDYINTCNGILSAIRMKKLPTRSYLIGAPNGFGKTSFVNECLMTLRHHGYKVAPFISLLELSYIRSENEKRLMSPYKKFYDDTEGLGGYYYTERLEQTEYLKKPEVITGRYSYSEYINADCLFVSLTDVISKDMESHALYQLLSIRGAKGLPTIVMMSTSIDPYFKDKALKALVWDEIIAHSEREYCYDRVYHVSTFRERSASRLEDKGVNVDSSTGIVY